MKPWHKLKYGGADPYKPEDERLPYPVFELLSQDDWYTTLAQLRYLAGEVYIEADSVDEYHVGDSYESAREAVEAYVKEWLAKRRDTFLEYGIEAEQIEQALEEYDVGAGE